MFPDIGIVREVQLELDSVIEAGVNNLVQLLKNNENEFSSKTLQLDEDSFEAKSRERVSSKNPWTHDDANLAGNMKNKAKSKGLGVLKELAETTTDFESERRSSDKNQQNIVTAKTKVRV